MKMRTLSVGLCLLLLCSILFSGCGGANSQTPTGNPSNVSDPTGTKGAVKPTGDKVALKLWHMEESPNRVQRFNEVFDQFNSSQSKVHVTVEVQTWNDAYTKFPAAIMAGNGPDLLATIPDHATVIYAIGAVQPVTDIVNKLEEKYSFFKSCTDPYKYGDDYYAIPAFGMSKILTYRKDLFDSAGLAEPKTWDDMLNAAKTLTKDGNYGVALPASLSMATDQAIYTFMASGGARTVIDKDNKVTFNNPQTVAAYDMYYRLLEYSPPDSSSYTWGEPESLFMSGKAAMACQQGQFFLNYEKNSGKSADTVGATLWPTPDGKSQTSSNFDPNAFLLLSKEQEKHDATLDLFTYLLEPETYGKFLTAEPGLFMTVTETGVHSKSYAADPTIVKFAKQATVLTEAIKLGSKIGFTDGVSMDIGKITGPNILARTLQQMTVNKMSAAEAVAWGQKEMEKAIAAP